MSYLIDTTKEADQDLALLDASLQDQIIRRLFELARSPSAMKTRPAQPPFPSGQLWEFELPFAGELWWVAIHYKYTQDEQSLSISRVYIELIP